MIKTKTPPEEVLDTDLDAAGVDDDIQARVLFAAGGRPSGGAALQLVADFILAWKKDPETLRTEMRREITSDTLPAMTPADAAAAGVPFTIDVPDPRGGDMWRVSTRPDGTQLSELVAGPSFESRQDDSLDAMASVFNVNVRAGDGLPRGRTRIGHAKSDDESSRFYSHTRDEIRRSPSLSMFYASRSGPLSGEEISKRDFVPQGVSVEAVSAYARELRRGPLSGEERALLHPDAERRRLNRELVTDVDDAAREQFSGAIAYLFGAVTDDPDYKRRFSAAQRYCERWGMTVLNPTRQPVTPAGPLPMEFYMRHGMIDVEACEVMIPVPSPFLEGSRGAAAERRYGECLQKPILDGFVKEEV